MTRTQTTITVTAALAASALLLAAPLAGQAPLRAIPQLFRTADACQACHNGLVTPAGADVSIGTAWRASMMANAARDPYWHAGVRREIMQHPGAAAAIEHECSACHMPMMRYEAKVAGGQGGVFAHLPIGAGAAREDLLAADGASCTTCHQARPDKLGTRDSFNAGFVVDHLTPAGGRPVYGPFEVAPGLASLMRSATAFVPSSGAQIRSSELCATCHTLFTHALGPDGAVVGEFPEQVPFLEWKHSRYATEKSCQDCHMAAIEEPTPIAGVLGEPRTGARRHEFRGGNFIMPRILNKHRAELGVTALASELEQAAALSGEHLRTQAAEVRIDGARVADGRLLAEIAVENRAGHKLPTAYPSRRAWLHLIVTDVSGAVVFESGRLEADGRIRGNDNDADKTRVEPHYEVVSSPDQVQIYEPILGDHAGAVTTGLIAAVRYLKDNRLLPHGFDKATADHDVAVAGGASTDADFGAGGDRLRLDVPVGGARGPLTVAAELLYQPIGYRWAHNLADFAAMETSRFVGYYRAMAPASSATLARAVAAAK